MINQGLDATARSLGADDANRGVFFARLGKAWEGLNRGFKELYGDHADIEALLEELARLLLEKNLRREARLLARDAAAAGKGPWYLEPGLAAYMLYLDRFAGDFAGLEKRVSWLEGLGIGLVHLMPFMKSPEGNNDGGYAVSDYLEVDPRLGSNADLVETARLLHSRGMFLAADLVLNHSADDHPWAKAARAGDRKYQDYYYIFPDRKEPDLFEKAMPEVFPATAPGNFTKVPELDSWVMTVFHDFQWDLNWTNPAVFLEMLEVILEMANRGIDLIRLDAVPYLWKKVGTSCQNLPEAHAIVRLLKAAAGVVAPSLAFLAEAIVQPSEIVKYLDADDGTGRIREECQLAYHASLMALLWEALATRKTGLLAASFGTETRLAPGTAWLSYARCHDDIGLGYDDALIRKAGYDPALHRRFLVDWYTGRFPGSLATGRPFMENPVTGDARISGSCASLCGLERALARGDSEDIELALRRIELLHALISSLVGIPMIFSGDELATTNDYSWEDSAHLADDNRWMHRPRLDWQKALGIIDGRTEGPHARGKRTRAPASEPSPSERIYRWIARCLLLRRGIPAFAQDAPFAVIPSSENILVAKRWPKGQAGGPQADGRVLVVANFCDSARDAVVDLGFFAAANADAARATAGIVDLLGGEIEISPEGRLRLPAYKVLWLARS